MQRGTSFMTSSDVLELARQGNPNAIATLISQALQAQGVMVRASLHNDCLIVLAEGATTPDEEMLANSIHRGMKQLNPPSIRRVKVRGYAIGNVFASWEREFSLPRNVVIFPRRNKKAARRSKTRLQGKTRWQNAIPPNRYRRFASFVRNALLVLVRMLLFALLTTVLVFLAASLRVVVIFLAEKFVYPIALVGDFLRGIDIVEILSILVFAIVGTSVGAGAILLPKRARHFLSATLLICLVPLIFSVGPAVKYEVWLQNFSANDRLSRLEAESLTNAFLQQRVESKGALGFYFYTARFPVVPIQKSDIPHVDRVVETLTGQVANVSGLSSIQVLSFFSACVWSIRAFYFFLFSVTTGIHFQKGIQLLSKPPR